MSSNRKYSRSRSPIDERSNSRKQDYSRRRRSPGSHRSQHSSDHSRDYDYDRKRSRHESSEARNRHHDRVRDRRDDEHKDDGTTSYRRRDGSRLSDYGQAVNDARASAIPRQVHTSANHGKIDLKLEGSVDREYGRLKTSANPPDRLPSTAFETEHSRKRKATETEEWRAADRGNSIRRSRFDRVEAPKPELNNDKTHSSLAVSSPSISIGNDSSKVSISENEKTANTDEEKLRQRQERLALWKKKKAEEAAKQVSDAGRPPECSTSPAQETLGSAESTTSFKPALGSPSRLPSQVQPTSSSGINKFGMATKQSATSSTTLSNKALGFSDEIASRRALPSIESIELTTRKSNEDLHTRDLLKNHETSQMTTGVQEDEIDPLDAFMAENSVAMDKSSGTMRSAGDIVNDQEYDAGFEVSEEEDILALAAKKAALKKKDIVTVNHALQDYEPVRKDFYVEPEELADLNESEVDAMRLELDGIVIRGKDCPKPVTHWGQCGLSADTLEQIQQLGYTSPTSIQAQAIPAIMAGRDTIGVAKTGSGKTMAFLLPMFRHIKDQRPLESGEGPIAMILTPTRELAVQIHKECKPFLKALDLRAVCVYGGPPIKEQIAEFKRGAEIVVCTPGRMIDMLAANQGRVTNLKRITYTVLDEADRMFDLGFEPQVMKIINNIRPQRQTVLFSATFPKSMEALARKILRGKPVEITVGARSVVAPEITQKIEIRPKDPDPLKFNRVLEILGELYNTDEDARTLIFVDRQEAADSLLYQLMRKGYPCNALHGGKDQYDRDSTISDFKAGIFPILVATSVAARGLDVKQLKLVINYDCPNHMEDYVHRVGRTGRAGNTGTAITFISEDQERYAFDIAKALRLSQVDIPPPLKILADAFAEKVKAGTEKGTAAGFGGKGLAKFDTARDNEKRVQRKIYGEDEDVEEEVAARKTELSDDDDSDEDNDRVNPEEAQAVAEMGTSASADAPIKVEKVTAQMRQATGARPNVGTKALDPVAAARARIDAINNRIKTGTKPMEQVASNPDAGEYRAMMEINDYPQKARWNVTNRTNIAKVLEATGTSITTQGQYVKPGSSAPAGVPKLYLLVEGPTELCVTDAVKELRRLLAEGTLADADAAGSRYKVV